VPGPGLEPRDRRLADLVTRIGAPDPQFQAQGLLETLTDEVSRNWALHVAPLIEAHWPELPDTRFYNKLRISTHRFLCHAPYLGIALSARRPSPIRALLPVCRGLRLKEASISWLLQFVYAPLARLFVGREGRDIVLGGALIFVLDEVLDQQLARFRPDQRGKILCSALEGTAAPSDGPLALANALRKALEAGSSPTGRREAEKVLHGCWSWTVAEAACQGATDGVERQNLREVGLRTAADGLAWTIRSHADASMRDWFFAVMRLVQMLDDLVDLEEDLAAGIRSPVATGEWTLHTAERAFEETTSSLRALAARRGITYGPLVSLLEGVFVQQVRFLLDLMISGAVT